MNNPLLTQQVNTAIAAIDYPAQPEELYNPIKYVLSIGGKRVRPLLLLLTYQLYRSDYEAAMQAAVGVETYHNYTLLHDDLMDRADMRRGKPTVHKKWNNNTAILSGDSMLVLALKLISSVDNPNTQKIVRLFLDTALQIGDGQQYDMNFENRMDVTEEEYIEMIRLKTSVLLACAVKMGAWLGGATDEEANTLYDFGEKLGLAFQLQDDLLDVYGDPLVFGKRIGGDILCNKKTFMLISAFRRAQDSQRKELEYWIAQTNPNPEEKIKAVTRIYNQLGIHELCADYIRHYFDEARKSLSQVHLSDQQKQPLWTYAASLIDRKY